MKKIFLILFCVFLLFPAGIYANNKYSSISQCRSVYDARNPNASYECYMQFPMSDCETINNPHMKVECYEQFAVKNNDTSLCFLASTYDGYSEGECVEAVAISNYDTSICDNINRKNLPQNSRGNILNEKCVAAVGIAHNDNSICEKVEQEYWREECFRRIKEDVFIEKRDKTSDSFKNIFISLLIFFVAAGIYFTTNTNYKKRNVLTILALILFPVIALGRGYIIFERLPVIAGGDATLHSVILLLYGFVCFLAVSFNIHYAYTKWRRGDYNFRTSIYKAYLYALLFTILISLIPFASQLGAISAGLISVKEFWGGVLFFSVIIGASLFFPVGLVSLTYSILGIKNRKICQKGFLSRIITFAILLLLLGAFPALFVLNFWIEGNFSM